MNKRCFVCGSEQWTETESATGITLCDSHAHDVRDQIKEVEEALPDSGSNWLRALADVMDVHRLMKEGVEELPRYTIDGHEWFRDKRLMEYRRVDDPHKRMSLWDGDSAVNDKFRNVDESKQEKTHEHQWRDYDGLLGYFSQKCTICGVDINDLKEAK